MPTSTVDLRRLRLALVGLVGGALLFNLVLIGLAFTVLPISRLPEGYVVHTCFGTSTGGHLRLSVWWLSPHLNSAPRWAYVAAGYPNCTSVPWLPVLPQSGNLHWP